MTKFSPGKVIVFIRSCTAKSPSASTPCIFSGWQDQRCEFGLLRQVETDLLDQGSLVDIAVIVDAEPRMSMTQSRLWFWTAPNSPNGTVYEGAALMAQSDRTKAEGFDGAFVIAALDVLADPKGVVKQIEHAGDDIANQRLRAKPIATPRTPAPATNGPISTPIAASDIIAAIQ